MAEDDAASNEKPEELTVRPLDPDPENELAWKKMDEKLKERQGDKE
jgi:hypothetical protein